MSDVDTTPTALLRELDEPTATLARRLRKVIRELDEARNEHEENIRVWNDARIAGERSIRELRAALRKLDLDPDLVTSDLVSE